MTRYGSVIGVRDETLDDYKALHAAVWPDVLTMHACCHIRYYSIVLRRMPDGQPSSSGAAAGETDNASCHQALRMPSAR